MKKGPESVRMPLDKKVPRNPKYDDVRSRIDTGMTVDKVKYISTSEYLKRRNELFFRLSSNQLHALFAEYEADHEDVEENKGGGFDGPRVVTIEADEKPSYQRPYLLLDLRTQQEYTQCHIMQARSFPMQMLNQDKMIADLYQYKNKEGQLIVLYCDNEAISSQAGHTLVTRGFDNIFLLTGGLFTFSELHPLYVEGTPPERPRNDNSRGSNRSGSGRGGRSGRLRGAGSEISGARSEMGGSMRGTTPRTLSGPSTSRSSASKRGDAQLTSQALARRHQAGSTMGGSRRGYGGGSGRSSRRASGDMDDMDTQMTSMTVAESVISQAVTRKGRY